MTNHVSVPHARFFFIHVMKSAGTSLINHAIDQYGLWRLWGAFYEIARLAARGQIDAETHNLVTMWAKVEPGLLRRLPWGGIRVFHGHMPYVTRQIFDASAVPVYCITILRDPVERVISHLAQDLRLVRGGDLDFPCDSLEALYEHPRWHDRFADNYQTKLFSMTPEETWWPGGDLEYWHEFMNLVVLSGYAPTWQRRHKAVRELKEMAHGQARHLPDPPHARPIALEHRRLAIAVKRLEEIDVLGVVPETEALLNEMRWRFGWKFKTVRENRMSAGERIPAALRQRILRDNAMDTELFQHAWRLVNNRRRQQARTYSF